MPAYVFDYNYDKHSMWRQMQESRKTETCPYLVCDVCLRRWDDDNEEDFPQNGPAIPWLKNTSATQIFKAPFTAQTLKDLPSRTSFFEITSHMTWANFTSLSPTIFQYGSRGRFQTKQPVQFKSYRSRISCNCHVCNICLRNIEFEPYNPIECDLCHKHFQQLRYGDSTVYNTIDGYGCASTITETNIFPNKGSHYKDRFYSWSAGIRPNKYDKIFQMCDECIDQLVMDVTIQRIL